jgi:hypothetical protein
MNKFALFLVNPKCQELHFVHESSGFVYMCNKLLYEIWRFLDDKDLCNIWDFHSGDYEECCLLGCGAV